MTRSNAPLDEEEQHHYSEEEYFVERERSNAISKTAGLEKLAARINLNDDTGRHYAVLNNPKLDKDRNQHTDRANRAVTEQVLDPRTRMMLLKLINKNVIFEVNGCISTGKEANVYHAEGERGEHFALKIYKSTILTFKAREKYVEGEFRFRKGYSKHNPRKMVQVWAEKEFRNLKRLRVAGIPSPEPLLLKMHIMLMTFIGDEHGVAAPRLKDAKIDGDKAFELYGDCIKLMRIMYQECKLVHADFSEYNLLLHEGKIVVIDVGQAVEHDHPRALDFLRHDCRNIISFFRQFNVPTLTIRRLFDFITDVSIASEDLDRYLAIAHEAALLEVDDELKKVDDNVFSHSYIPRTLDDVIDIERDVDRIQSGDTEKLLYTKLTGLDLKSLAATDSPLKKPEKGSGFLDSPSDPSNSSDSLSEDLDSQSDSSDSLSDSSDSLSDFSDTSPLSKEEVRRLRKENKTAVKAEKKEKRKNKTPKHVKKRRDKLARRH
jgi:RIO kinase 1